MKKIFKHSIQNLLLVAVLFAACKKDKGNYNYKAINEMQAVENLPDVVEAIYGKQLVIDPVVKFSLDPNFDTNKYSYEWSYIGPNGLGGSKLFILATTQKLDILTNLAAGNYAAYYCVTDKATGVKYRKDFTLKVSNEINEGWILMCDVNNTARVDILSKKSDATFELIPDLLHQVGSDLQLKGKPVMTYTYNTGLLLGPDKISYGLYFGTDQGTTKVDPNTFKWTPTMTLNYEMYGAVPTGFYADLMQQRSNNAAYMIGKGNAYFYYRTLNIYYATPINYISAEQSSFEVAPFIAGNHAIIGGAHAIFYDKTNKRFVKHNGEAATCVTLPDPVGPAKKFSFSTGMDLVFMKWVPFNGGEVFAVLKDSNNKKYLARFNSANLVQSYYDEIVGTDIANADKFAFSPDLGYIFYNVGSKVYEYDMNYKTSKLMLDYGSKSISYMKFYDFKATSKYTGSNKLMIGLVDGTKAEGTNGSLEIFTVPPVNGDLVLADSFSGFGKIKDITYRER